MTPRRILIIAVLLIVAFAAIWVVDRRVMQRTRDGEFSRPVESQGE